MSKKFFNVAGPCWPGRHYMLDPLRGIGDELMDLVDGGHYFVIHAARQSGKTTLLKELARKINARGEHYALYCSLEAVEVFSDPEKGIPEIVSRVESCIKNQGLPAGFAENADYSRISGVLNSAFVDYCRTLDKPLVVFFDEADCLSNGTLITFLKQLREGYVSMPDTPFVHSVALVGMRKLRDYKASVRPDSDTLGGTSPFNIVKKSINLKNFTEAEVAEFYAQHTAATGQVFEAETVEYVFEQTQGQLWLVNAIACECVEEILRKDYSKPITRDLAEQAIQSLILVRGTHFDSLMERLKEPRVRKIISPLILGEDGASKLSDDYMYVKDLGLIRDDCGKTEPANPIYAELIVRALSWDAQDKIANELHDHKLPRYLKDGRIDIDFLIRDFQVYWRENSEIWEKRYEADLYQYNEAAAHLVMYAFFQRVINSAGKVTREMALGIKRGDMCVEYQGRKYPIELKILQSMRSSTDGFSQILAYMDRVGSDVGWLVIFDRDTERSWDDKIYMREEVVDGKRITVAGC